MIEKHGEWMKEFKCCYNCVYYNYILENDSEECLLKMRDDVHSSDEICEEFDEIKSK